MSISDTFFEEENRSGYIVSEERKRIWAVELDLLLEFDRVCKQLHIQYYLDSGTLLGAIRHKGFIPWDDDIDVVLLREDYDVLNKKGSSMFREPYFFQNIYTDPFFFGMHAKLRNSNTAAISKKYGKNALFNQGIFIDIFVMDGLTLDYDRRYAQFKELINYRKIITRMRYQGGSTAYLQYLKKVYSYYLKFTKPSAEELYNQYEKTIKRYGDSDYIDLLFFRKNVNRVRYFKRKWYESTIEVEFEGFVFPAPVGTPLVLKEYYGEDYMTPKQSPGFHGDLLFDTEHSYLDVIKTN